MARRSVGSVSRMRVSSVTTPSLSGTLKSTRMKTRFPRRSRSLMVSLFIVQEVASDEWLVARRASPFLPPLSQPISSEFGGQEFDEVAATAGIAPLVVVPGQDFYAAVADNFGVFGIDNRGIRIPLEVGRDEFFLGVGEDALHRAIGGGFQRGVDGFLSGGLVDKDGQVDNANVGRGDAHGIAVELALQLGNDKVEGFGGAGGAGNHVDGGG